MIEPRIVSASREVAASAAAIFELIADPAEQTRWDGNDNLAQAAPGQRVHGVGDAFTMTLTNGADRVNRIVEFEEGRRIAWLPSEPGGEPPGHTLVAHTYDWSNLNDPNRLKRARATTSESLARSLDRLAALAEAP